MKEAAATTLPSEGEGQQVRDWAGILSELVKARLTLLVLLTTSVGYYMGLSSALSWIPFFHTMFGTALLACGAATLNQWIEIEHDARMPRTESRPLPSGRIHPDVALLLGGLFSSSGMVYLLYQVNTLTAVLGALTLGSYLFAYTPLKRRTWLNTIIGAIPGALPPLMGWTAATGGLHPMGWSLFLILFLWQLPHFFAIAWLYRKEYAQAGFVMLPLHDTSGRRTATHAVVHTSLLILAGLLPFLLGACGPIYAAGALLLGGYFVASAVQFAGDLTESSARKLFFTSILYLPLILGLMVWAKTH